MKIKLEGKQELNRFENLNTKTILKIKMEKF